MRIGLDLDGVLYDFVAAHRHWLCQTEPERFDVCDLPEPTSWSIWETWPLTREEWQRSLDEGVRVGAIFGGQFDYDGAIAACARLAEAGHELHIITHRPLAGMRATAEWLRWTGLPFVSVTFAEDKTTVPLDVIVEDNVDNALAVAATAAEAILIDRPWNRTWHVNGAEVTPEQYAGLRRAHDWQHVESIIEELALIERNEAGIAGEVAWAFPLPSLPDAAYALLAEPVEITFDSSKVEPAFEGIASRTVDRARARLERRSWVVPGLRLPEVDPVEELEPWQVAAAGSVIGGSSPAGEERHTSDSGGEKGRKLARFHMIPPDVLHELAEHYGKGEAKYPGDPVTGQANWQKGYPWSWSVDAHDRHLNAWLRGEDFDDETGSSHLVAAIWHLIDLRWQQLHETGRDDLYARSLTA